MTAATGQCFASEFALIAFDELAQRPQVLAVFNAFGDHGRTYVLHEGDQRGADTASAAVGADALDRSLIDRVSAAATRRSVIKALVALTDDIGASTGSRRVEHAARSRCGA